MEEYIVNRGGIKTKSDESCIPVTVIEDEEVVPIDPYIARIIDVGGKFGLEREFLKAYSVEASLMKRGYVFEVRFFNQIGERRLYYVVRDGLFCLFAEHIS